MTFPSLHVQEPWLSHIISGEKTIEGRRGPLSKFSKWIGQIVIFYNEEQWVPVVIKGIRHYNTLGEYAQSESWRRVAPGATSYQGIIALYYDIIDEKGERPYSPEAVEASGGMNALVVEVV